MTRQRSLMILLLAIVSATVAGFAAVQYANDRPVQGAPVDDGGTTQLVVAARDLPVGHLVSEADLQVIRWPARALPAGYVAQPASVVGRGLIQGVRTNAPILEPDLAERGSGAGMPIRFPEGMRAVSVRVDEVIAVAGWVLPQTRVDVLLTMKPNPSAEQTYTQTILQNLLVLAAGQTFQRDEQGRAMPVSVVTLMVTPEQGEKLTLASQQGRIQLALRNMLDVDEVQTPGVGDGRLMEIGRGGPTRTATTPAPRPRAAAPDSSVIETYRGGVRSLQRF